MTTRNAPKARAAEASTHSKLPTCRAQARGDAAEAAEWWCGGKGVWPDVSVAPGEGAKVAAPEGATAPVVDGIEWSPSADPHTGGANWLGKKKSSLTLRDR